MATESNKENIADGLVPTATEKAMLMSPKRTKKSRSLSMGPGSSVVLKELNGNRRKSAFPSVKSILGVAKDATEADIFKRKEARRKSLANRRVSFAPEATLHTWDVIEYMKDATSSSASSEATQRASAASQELSFKSPDLESPQKNDEPESPSTPTKQVVEAIPAGATPDSQRDLHKKKRRRSSTGMHLKNPEEIFSSSPLSDKSPAKDAASNESDSDDMGDATMDLDDPTIQSIVSGESAGSDSSNARLDAALRAAAVQAGNQRVNMEDDGDATMVLVDEEVTNAFRPWVHKSRRDSAAVQRMVLADQENIDPFQLKQAEDQDGDVTQDMSMDITRAIGGIVKDDTVNTSRSVRGLKRRRSSNIAAMGESSGSPMQRPNTRRSISRRQSLAEASEMGDATMDFTMAVGSIQPKETDNQQEVDESVTDETMDFTIAIGSIIKNSAPPEAGDNSVANTELLEDMSMEITENLGKALSATVVPATPSPAKTNQSPKKPLLPASVTVERGHTPQKSPATPKVASVSKVLAQPSPRRSARKSVGANRTIETPVKTPERMSAVLASPIRRTPQQFSPIPKASDVVPTKKSEKSSSITETLRLLSTPRKEILPAAVLPPPSTSRKTETSPKRTLATPRKNATPKRTLTPNRSASPRKRVKINVEQSPEKRAQDEDVSELSEGDKISLPDFLSMTNIRFMDLTTTKRRATGHPGAEGMLKLGMNEAEDEEEPSLENNVAAAVAVVPMLSMYQHSCQEMKSYISSGRTEIKNLEEAALETQPPLFHDYASASAAEKNIMDAQLRDLKTNARLQSKSGWHNWRSQLLNDLKTGLQSTSQDLDADDKILSLVEASFEDVLPSLLDQETQLENELRRLEVRKHEQEDNSGAELEEARERLIAAEEMLKQQSLVLESLKSELSTSQSALEDALSWRAETIASIQEADRITQEHRGWSVEEVRVLQSRLTAVESRVGWSLVSASNDSITLAHNDLHLSLCPKSWITASNTPESDGSNTSISLTYVGKQVDDNSPQATTRRFFLQLLRAQILSLAQCHTTTSSLLSLITSGWNLASCVQSALAALQVGGITHASIESDERIALTRVLLLPTLETKVHIRFGIHARVLGEDVVGTVKVEAKVIYGEKYDEIKMGDHVSGVVAGRVGTFQDVSKWADIVEDLKVRLLRRGRKGGRI